MTPQDLQQFLATLESYSTAVQYDQCFCKILHIERNEALKKSK